MQKTITKAIGEKYLEMMRMSSRAMRQNGRGQRRGSQIDVRVQERAISSNS